MNNYRLKKCKNDQTFQYCNFLYIDATRSHMENCHTSFLPATRKGRCRCVASDSSDTGACIKLAIQCLRFLAFVANFRTTRS